MSSSLSLSFRSNLKWSVPAALAASVWATVVFGSFQYDDFANILEDPATHHVQALLQRLATGIRPLTRASYALSDLIFGDRAGGWLLINALLHLFTSIGVAKLAHLRTLNARAAAFAGVCFALQPAHAAVIAYVSGRSAGLATAFIVAAMIMHERSTESSKLNHKVLWAALLFACACAAKETALVFPALVLLWERTRPVSTSWPIALKRTVLYALIAIAAAVAMLLLSPRYRELLMFSLSLRAPLDALLHNVIALPMSIGLWFTPWALSVEHDVPFCAALLFVNAAAIAIALTLAIHERARRPVVTLALLWPLLAMLATHSVIAKTDAITEGPLYLAWIGPSIMLGEWLSKRVRDDQGARVKAVSLAICVVAIALCEWRVSVWRDSVRLWREATLHAPASARAWTNLGVAQLARGRTDSARDALQIALRLDPSSMQARLNLDIVAALAASARSTKKL